MSSVRATAPVRIADVGGWTDTWFGSPGQVCHVAVGPGVTVDASVVPGGAIEVVAPDVGAGPHPLLAHAVASVLDPLGLDPSVGVRVEISSAVPPGASLGTSASVLVAVIGALDALVAGGSRVPAEIAVLAHQVETGRAGREAGVQDHWAAAMGGCGLLAIGPYPDVRHEPVPLAEGTIAELAERLVTVVFGPHDSSAVHAQVINDIVGCGGPEHDRARAALRRLSTLAGDAAAALADGDLGRWGSVLVESTTVQATLHPALVGAPHAAAIEVARRAGGVGWKVNGAGGDGGSLTVLVAPGATDAVTEALRATDPGWRVLELSPSPVGLAVHLD